MPGAAAYFGGDVPTIFDKYGDQFFYASMLLGMLSSVVAAIWKFMLVGPEGGTSRPPERLHSMTGRIRDAKNEDDLEKLEDEIDEIIRKELAKSRRGRGRCRRAHDRAQPARISDRSAAPLAGTGATGSRPHDNSARPAIDDYGSARAGAPDRGAHQDAATAARTGRPARRTLAWISTMQAPVAPSIWKLTMVPSAADVTATAVAITSMRSNESVSR